MRCRIRIAGLVALLALLASLAGAVGPAVADGGDDSSAHATLRRRLTPGATLDLAALLGGGRPPQGVSVDAGVTRLVPEAGVRRPPPAGLLDLGLGGGNGGGPQSGGPTADDTPVLSVALNLDGLVPRPAPVAAPAVAAPAAPGPSASPPPDVPLLAVVATTGHIDNGLTVAVEVARPNVASPSVSPVAIEVDTGPHQLLQVGPTDGGTQILPGLGVSLGGEDLLAAVGGLLGHR